MKEGGGYWLVVGCWCRACSCAGLLFVGLLGRIIGCTAASGSISFWRSFWVLSDSNSGVLRELVVSEGQTLDHLDRLLTLCLLEILERTGLYHHVNHASTIFKAFFWAHDEGELYEVDVIERDQDRLLILIIAGSARHKYFVLVMFHGVFEEAPHLLCPLLRTVPLRPLRLATLGCDALRSTARRSCRPEIPIPLSDTLTAATGLLARTSSK